jgi:hypothetical protein
MDIEQWKQAAIRHFRSGTATDEHWQVVASCLLHASESEGLDGGLDQIIDPDSLGPEDELEIAELAAADPEFTTNEPLPKWKPEHECDLPPAGTVLDVFTTAALIQEIERRKGTGRHPQIEIVGPDGQVHYRRPWGDPLIVEALARPGYSVRRSWTSNEPFSISDDPEIRRMTDV